MKSNIMFDVKQYGAAGDGVTDDTAAIQAAMDAASETGGCVVLSPAKYLVKGCFKVPAGVSVVGSAFSPRYSDPLTGTVLLATFGRGHEDGQPLFEMANSTLLSGFTVYYPVKTGYRFIAGEHGMANGQFCGIGADYAHRCMVVDAVQQMGLLVTNGQFVAFAGKDPVQIEIGPECSGSVRFENCAFWGHSEQNVLSRGKGFLSLSNCYLGSGRGAKKPLVEASAGRLQVRGCSFSTGELSVAVRAGVKHAIISENNGAEGVTVENEIGADAVVINNESK